MSSASPGPGPDDHPTGGSPAPPEGARSGRGVAIVVVTVVVGVLLLPSATRAPLVANASTATPATTAPHASKVPSHGHHTSGSTTTTILPSAIHVLVANATTTNGVAADVTRFLSSKGFGTLVATNALVKVTASEIFTVGGATADVLAVALALNLPAASIEPAASSAPVSSSAGANVVVIVGPDLAARYGPGATTTAPPSG